jgi:putative Holliday junction resolvase
VQDKPEQHARLSPLTADSPRTGSVLAFDFGEKRIGVAVGDLTMRIAHPLATIRAEDNATRFGEIAKLVSEWRPACVVVGLPMHADGTEHEVSRLARRFAQRLEGRFGIPSILVDERLTSRAAATRLKEAGVVRGKLENVLDSAAAREILEAYFASVRDST